MAARHHHKKVHGEHYSGHEERRKQEREDANLSASKTTNKIKR